MKNPTRLQQLFIIFGGVIIGGVVTSNLLQAIPEKSDIPDIPKTKYIEEPYTTADGTPCTVLRSRSGPYVGVTCNYDATPINERK
jgi:hypothetical protein